ncbi:MAG: 23S rRNA (adenine(2503)-C(2))-methyltransferase RlmN [Oscillospiraceae bacterium]|nr:23S rRNA (adenine(2503)-C(2))-methyltransferase RlmN [Oscillospiraceae bacterium]
MTLEEIQAEFKTLGQPGYRAKQVFQWVHRGAEFEEMSNLSKPLREELAKAYFLKSPIMERRQQSKLDGTIKYLWKFADGSCVESVLMSYAHGNTICVSTQVGCAMGCAFCASTVGGKVRDLTAGEILDQVYASAKESGRKISNIVLMGIGEPLDNMENVLRFLELVNSPEGLNIGMRHISLSTCGLVPEIDKLAELHIQLTLSVSLHSADNDTRSTIMPINRRYPVEELMECCGRYFEKTGRRISYEYAMINDVTDTPEQAKLLIKYLRGTGSHVNLIPLNPTDRGLVPSTAEKVARFRRQLEQAGINVTVRRSLGGDIDASCGQLRKKTAERNSL